VTAILTLNAGSSSLKLGLYDDRCRPLASGLVDRIGPQATLRLRDSAGFDLALPQGGVLTHAEALQTALRGLDAAFPELRIVAVGHRVVHGGMEFAGPTAIDTTVLSRIADLVPFAPLHQPHNIAGIDAAMRAFPDALQVACFDTAFHRGHTFAQTAYALPGAYFDKGVRRYGFHGLSYQSIAETLSATAPHLSRVVVAHLGNGASLCALYDGRSVSSTMGFTALDGLPMGTRPGQIDPGVLLYMLQQEGLTAAEVSDLLYRRSGLLGLSGLSPDMRVLEAAGSDAAERTISYFTTRIRREIAALAADLGGIDGIVFTAGIGENSARIRAEVCAGLTWLGAALDPARNDLAKRVISAEGSAIELRVIPTDEEGVIAKSTRAALGMHPQGPSRG
jgi:acetate kinase